MAVRRLDARGRFETETAQEMADLSGRAIWKWIMIYLR